jgi:hypothetical protein
MLIQEEWRSGGQGECPLLHMQADVLALVTFLDILCFTLS